MNKFCVYSKFSLKVPPIPRFLGSVNAKRQCLILIDFLFAFIKLRVLSYLRTNDKHAVKYFIKLLTLGHEHIVDQSPSVEELLKVKMS